MKTDQMLSDLRSAHDHGLHSKRLVFGCPVCAERCKPVDHKKELERQSGIVQLRIEALYNEGVDSLVESLNDEFAKLLAMLELGE